MFTTSKSPTSSFFKNALPQTSETSPTHPSSGWNPQSTSPYRQPADDKRHYHQSMPESSWSSTTNNNVSPVHTSSNSDVSTPQSQNVYPPAMTPSHSYPVMSMSMTPYSHIPMSSSDTPPPPTLTSSPWLHEADSYNLPSYNPSPNYLNFPYPHAYNTSSSNSHNTSIPKDHMTSGEYCQDPTCNSSDCPATLLSQSVMKSHLNDIYSHNAATSYHHNMPTSAATYPFYPRIPDTIQSHNPDYSLPSPDSDDDNKSSAITSGIRYNTSGNTGVSPLYHIPSHAYPTYNSCSSSPPTSPTLQKSTLASHLETKSRRVLNGDGNNKRDQEFNLKNGKLGFDKNLLMDEINSIKEACHVPSALDTTTSILSSTTSCLNHRSDPHNKPPYSYITLIVAAMRSKSSRRITLNEIYAWIMKNFVFYKRNCRRWQNSIRHALSFNDCFIKVARPTGEAGKGSYWTIHPNAVDMFENGSTMRRNRKFVDSDKEVDKSTGRGGGAKMSTSSTDSQSDTSVEQSLKSHSMPPRVMSDPDIKVSPSLPPLPCTPPMTSPMYTSQMSMSTPISHHRNPVNWSPKEHNSEGHVSLYGTPMTSHASFNGYEMSTMTMENNSCSSVSPRDSNCLAPPSATSNLALWSEYYNTARSDYMQQYYQTDSGSSSLIPTPADATNPYKYYSSNYNNPITYSSSVVHSTNNWYNNIQNGMMSAGIYS